MKPATTLPSSCLDRADGAGAGWTDTRVCVCAPPPAVDSDGGEEAVTDMGEGKLDQ